MAQRIITADDMDTIALGGAFLGTGGGGDPYIGKLMAKAAIEKYGPVTVISADSVADDALCVPVFMMGAPTVMLEKLPQGEEAIAALHSLEAYMGRKVDAVMCVEAGGLNSTIPFAVAAATGLPLIDGDGMGRAFPGCKWSASPSKAFRPHRWCLQMTRQIRWCSTRYQTSGPSDWLAPPPSRWAARLSGLAIP